MAASSLDQPSGPSIAEKVCEMTCGSVKCCSLDLHAEQRWTPALPLRYEPILTSCLRAGACAELQHAEAPWTVSQSGAKTLASALRCGGRATMYTTGAPSLSTARTLTSTRCTMMMASVRRCLSVPHLTGKKFAALCDKSSAALTTGSPMLALS